MLVHMAAASEQRQDPARVGILAAADVEPEPDAVVEPFAAWATLSTLLMSALALEAFAPLAARRLPGVEQILGRRQRRAVRADERGGDILGRALGEQRSEEHTSELQSLMRNSY